MPDLLIEIGCEELPAAVCAEAERQLPQVLARELAAAALEAAEIRVHVAPRRLAALAFGLPAERPPERRETRGPRADAPAQAREGFARRHGLAATALVAREGALWAVVEGAPTPVAELVPDLVARLVAGLDFPQTMRWEGGRFPRPIRWLVLKLDGDVVAAEVAGVAAGGTSRGLRTGPREVPVGSAATYVDDLRAAGVVADAGERRTAIVAGLDALGGWDDPMGKLAEVVHLVEAPKVHEGTFSPRYLELPERVPITAMQSHQRYFPLREDGRLAPRFAVAANGGRPEVVVAGHEEVLVGRLEDAAFAVARDRRRGIAAMAAELGRVSFLEGGGSLADKTARLGRLVALLAERNELAAADVEAARRAAALAKADLVSRLVSEFADLQGYAGATYAREAGEPEPVAAAVEEHHRPLEAGGAPPATTAGALLALADKLDTVAAAFALGARPTGSRDPYGLRRAAAGAAAIALERGWRVDPAVTFAAGVRGVAEAGGSVRRPEPEAVETATAFLLDRVAGVVADEGVTVEEQRAARGGEHGGEPARFAALARELRRRRGTESLARLRETYERSRRIAARADGAAAPSAGALAEPAEIALADALARVDAPVAAAVAAGDYAAAFRELEGLVAPVERLFEDVLVMAEDPAVRAGRLALVAAVAASVRRVGDLEQLPGG